MKVVHAGLYPQLIREVKAAVPGIEVNALVSLPYIDGGAWILSKLRHEDRLLDFLMLDTGTFGRNALSNKPLPPSRAEEYSQYVRLYGHLFDLVSAYDEDFDDPELNQAILEKMRVDITAPSKPSDPEKDERRIVLADSLMPVVHSQDGAFDEFKYYHELGYNYIAIGSSPEPKIEEIEKIQAYRYQHQIKVHRFGKTVFKEIRDFAPDSVDSTNYAMSVAYNEAIILHWNNVDPENPGLVEIKSGCFDEKIHGEYIRQAGFNFSYSDLMANIWMRHAVNVYSSWLLQKWLTDVWAEQHRAKYVTST